MASSGSHEINHVNPVNPVRKYFGFLSDLTCKPYWFPTNHPSPYPSPQGEGTNGNSTASEWGIWKFNLKPQSSTSIFICLDHLSFINYYKNQIDYFIFSLTVAPKYSLLCEKWIKVV